MEQNESQKFPRNQNDRGNAEDTTQQNSLLDSVDLGLHWAFELDARSRESSVLTVEMKPRFAHALSHMQH